jgi:hypothetical protein
MFSGLRQFFDVLKFCQKNFVGRQIAHISLLTYCDGVNCQQKLKIWSIQRKIIILYVNMHTYVRKHTVDITEC